MWTADEAGDYDRLSEAAAKHDTGMPEYVKSILKHHIAAKLE